MVGRRAHDRSTGARPVAVELISGALAIHHPGPVRDRASTVHPPLGVGMERCLLKGGWVVGTLLGPEETGPRHSPSGLWLGLFLCGPVPHL